MAGAVPWDATGTPLNSDSNRRAATFESVFVYFFFSSRRRHTRWNCDWSSDVCSSDLSLTVTCPRDLVLDAPVKLAEGTQVVVRGKPSFYTGRGTFSLRLSEIRAVGVGELLARIDRLRQLLDAEGLFDPRLKRPIPFLPNRIGLITGRASAAERDVT